MSDTPFIDGAHAATGGDDIVPNKDKPKGYSLSAIQYWTRAENKFTGRKADMSDYFTGEAMAWWSARPYGNAGFADKATARAELKQHLKARARERYGFVWTILLGVFVNIVISVVSKMIIEWLFSDKGEQRIIHDNRGIYFFEAADGADT
jgi:hypothetical protein